MNQKGRIDFLESSPSDAPASVTGFLFHGFGADAYDLRSLSEVLRPPAPTRWIFPQGIREVPIGPGWMGRAWWPIDLARFERATATAGDKGPFEWTDKEPENLPALREQLLTWISGFEKDWSRVILGGFSQGAMLACDLFLHAPQTPAGLLLFSGSLINKPNWQKVASRRQEAKYFQSHGRQDPVLPFRSAAQLETFLNQSGLKGSLFAFDGGHEIPWFVIEKANTYLGSLNLPK